MKFTNAIILERTQFKATVTSTSIWTRRTKAITHSMLSTTLSNWTSTLINVCTANNTLAGPLLNFVTTKV